MFTVLRPSAKKLVDKLASSFHDSVTSASDEGCRSREELYRALLQGFIAGKEWGYGRLSDAEQDAARELEKKYRSPEWNESR